jgi:hypothetical protein
MMRGAIIGIDKNATAFAESVSDATLNAMSMPSGVAVRSSFLSDAAGRHVGATADGSDIYIITLEPDKWAQYLKQMDMGEKAFRQQQPQSRALSLGLAR